MERTNFTASRIGALKCELGRQQSIFWDAKQPGLGLRVTGTGARAYIFEGRLHGRTVRMTIGSPDVWPLESHTTRDSQTGDPIERRGARQEAARLKLLVDQGVDPRAEKEAARAAHEAERIAAQRKNVSVADAWSVYLAARRSKWSERHYLDHVRLAEAGGREAKRGKKHIIAGPLAALMLMRLSELTREYVDGWLEGEAEKRPARARLAFSLLKAFVTWCDSRPEYKGLASMDICANKQLREHLPKPQVKDDCLQREQLSAWFAAVRNIPNPVIATYLQGLLITGARREELAGLRWDDLDFQWGSLTIRDKVEGERTIPLPPFLASLLLDLKRRNDVPPNVSRLRAMEAHGKKWEPSPWVFSSPTSADGKLAEPRIAHTKALEVAGLPHVSLHGLRRSFGTLSEWCEVPVGVVAQIQGHKPSAIAEKHYRRRPLDLLRAWHVKIERWLLEQAGIQFEPEQTTTDLKLVAAA
ncbi:tyrosine-type recombinase/integrase [Cupriavidus pinatubonensis]|uniref:Tyr recombinase domain-containing protein n=1 Tax=Cupriavidus pinatubonensis TaxID=248026 RepID=A0ABN7XUR0_9BURK|nr:integrase family protein [Cupriavidus pinatubonensis]CAG9163838.1 hypothetical protein LMG23994_00299 [Cupriavidus pinatubonensis]